MTVVYRAMHAVTGIAVQTAIEIRPYFFFGGGGGTVHEPQVDLRGNLDGVSTGVLKRNHAYMVLLSPHELYIAWTKSCVAPM